MRIQEILSLREATSKDGEGLEANLMNYRKFYRPKEDKNREFILC